MAQPQCTKVSPVSCFPPIADKNARVLILGTMPGMASLKVGQYYGYPQNAFWKIMGELVGAKPLLSYEQRVAVLRKNHIAVWDVLANCVRPGSLDSNISAEIPNDFQPFFDTHPSITHVFFNGAPAEKFFKKFVMNNIASEKFIFTTLPSTSPANASWNFQRKLEAWRKALDFLVPSSHS